MSAPNFAGTGMLPHGGHRMADPAVRVRVFTLILALVGLAWASVALLGNPRFEGFNAGECRELAGLPLPPECISERVPPGAPFSQPGVTP